MLDWLRAGAEVGWGVGGGALELPLPLPIAYFFHLTPTPSANISSPQSSTVTKSKMAAYYENMKMCTFGYPKYACTAG